ncbi:MAG: aldo/keto reductase [Bryobacteraceae bacterium]
MHRRQFLQMSGTAAAAFTGSSLPAATLGRTGLRVTRICVGGHHMRVRGEDEGIRIIRRAIDLGVNFFDSAHHYNNGESDVTYGKALAGGLRQRIVLMGKAHLRTRDAAMRQLEETLRRMQTSHLDLWQCHEVSTMDEVERIFAPGGALEAFVRAKEQGKARHIGFTGHRDPRVHLEMLKRFEGWETVQHPVNLIDPHYLSFIGSVLPEVRRKGLGRIAMKSNGMGSIGKNGVASIQECLRFAWSQDVDTLVSGVETVAQLEENVAALRAFQPMSREEQRRLLARTAKGPHGSKVERYKKPEDGAWHAPHRDGERA